MQAILDALKWLVTGSHWSGSDGIPVHVWEHVELSLAAVAVAGVIAIPVGLYVGHNRRFELLAVSVANLGRAIPSFGILVIAYAVILKIAASKAFGFTPTLVALVLLGIPPMLTNTYVGIQAVDRDTVEAAKGMGMTGRQILRRLEVPLAAPLIMAGIRTSAVTIVATATLSALIGGGTLGRFIVDGFAQKDNPKLIAGAILVALLAILTEVGLGLVERAVTPRTSSRGRRRGVRARARLPQAA